MSNTASQSLPQPIVVGCEGADLDDLLSVEWLLTNKLGAYASSTAAGCHVRRYHGLLVAATAPPVGKMLTLATVMETLTVDGTAYELATNEFDGVFSPRGFEYLAEFRNDVAPTYVYRIGEAELTKEIILARSANAVAIRYTLAGAAARLTVRPFASMRDFHHLRSAAGSDQMTFTRCEDGVVVEDRRQSRHRLCLVSRDGAFEAGPQWWYRIRYRVDLARGQDGEEDIYSPGAFIFELGDGESCQLTAGLDEAPPLDFDTAVQRRRERLAELASSVGDNADETTRRLAMASDAFVVQRSFPNVPASATIVAGYHWFADWGRDTFIALPGLLLCTGRFEQAEQVFRTFAGHISNGMVPNRFDDYSAGAHYNSLDASLWFIIAAERYLAAGGDERFWREVLAPAAETILHAYSEGTLFDIHADADGLLMGGSPQTQLTWMDAQSGGRPVTPRHGKAIEINALWHCAHRIVAERCAKSDPPLAERCRHQAELIAAALMREFWNKQADCLYDCVSMGKADASIRPNQIFAVSLPHSPLAPDKQAAVVAKVAGELLTPLGLRTLSPRDDRYCGRCAGSWEQRDSAYHQGTAWAWLMGPFIEAYLKVKCGSAPAVEQARQWLSAFDDHISEAGVGYISEIFDGDKPHHPRGCIAQAWSVAEVLRAKMLVEQYARKL